MTGFSFARLVALLRKESIQILRDTMTLRIIIADPDHAALPVRLCDQLRSEAPAGRHRCRSRIRNTPARSPRR